MSKENSPYIHVERTLVIIKPDIIHHADQIEEFILKKGFFIIQKRRVHLTPEQVSEFYAEHYGKIFFPTLVAYISSGPIEVLVIAKENAISIWRELIGPQNALKAKAIAPESLRAIYGTDDQQNGIHGVIHLRVLKEKFDSSFQIRLWNQFQYDWLQKIT
ncbi:unnamed protein product [Heterobilharzia americana]|nr:unnamed protein product [Heterobilharzia americana]